MVSDLTCDPHEFKPVLLRPADSMQCLHFYKSFHAVSNITEEKCDSGDFHMDFHKGLRSGIKSCDLDPALTHSKMLILIK